MVVLRHEIGDVLRDVRQRQGRTLREVSHSARVSLGYLSEVERGQKEASSELLSSICSALDVPLSRCSAKSATASPSPRASQFRTPSRRNSPSATAATWTATHAELNDELTTGHCSPEPARRSPQVTAREGPRLWPEAFSVCSALLRRPGRSVGVRSGRYSSRGDAVAFVDGVQLRHVVGQRLRVPPSGHSASRSRKTCAPGILDLVHLLLALGGEPDGLRPAVQRVSFLGDQAEAFQEGDLPAHRRLADADASRPVRSGGWGPLAGSPSAGRRRPAPCPGWTWRDSWWDMRTGTPPEQAHLVFHRAGSAASRGPSAPDTAPASRARRRWQVLLMATILGSGAMRDSIGANQ